MKNKVFILACFSSFLISCSSSDSGGSGTPTDPDPIVPGVNEVDFWLTKGDQSVKLAKQTTVLDFTTTANLYPNIEVIESQTFQSIDGFGYTLTSGSADVINILSPAKKAELLQDLFGPNGIRVTELRISIGASDLSSAPYTYNDLPSGQTDINLDAFSLENDAVLIGLLQEIIAINPDIKISATPWSAPVWMKTNGAFVGGNLKPEYYSVYANYFVKYIQQMQTEGITIAAITPQNEPLHGGNNPSLVMTAPDQNEFIKNHLGPAFQSAGLETKIVVYDHNADHPEYPISILNDAVTRNFVDGSAFHLYAGDINNLSQVHNAHPDKHIYFTEQYTSGSGSFDGDLKWHLKNVVIGSLRNWSRNVLEWNLANNANYGPHTDGGCSDCKGAITVNSSSAYAKNVSYYIIAHVSKFVPPGSVRIGSNNVGTLNSVAFKTPDNKTVLVVANDGNNSQIFNIKHNGQWTPVSIDGSAVATFVW